MQSIFLEGEWISGGWCGSKQNFVGTFVVENYEENFFFVVEILLGLVWIGIEKMIARSYLKIERFTIYGSESSSKVI